MKKLYKVSYQAILEQGIYQNKDYGSKISDNVNTVIIEASDLGEVGKRFHEGNHGHIVGIEQVSNG